MAKLLFEASSSPLRMSALPRQVDLNYLRDELEALDTATEIDGRERARVGAIDAEGKVEFLGARVLGDEVSVSIPDVPGTQPYFHMHTHAQDAPFSPSDLMFLLAGRREGGVIASCLATPSQLLLAIRTSETPSLSPRERVLTAATLLHDYAGPERGLRDDAVGSPPPSAATTSARRMFGLIRAAADFRIGLYAGGRASGVLTLVS